MSDFSFLNVNIFCFLYFMTANWISLGCGRHLGLWETWVDISDNLSTKQLIWEKNRRMNQQWKESLVAALNHKYNHWEDWHCVTLDVLHHTNKPTNIAQEPDALPTETELMWAVFTYQRLPQYHHFCSLNSILYGTKKEKSPLEKCV